MSQLPPIHAAQTFHAPETAAPHFDAAVSPMPGAPGAAVVSAPVMAVPPAISAGPQAPSPGAASDPVAVVAAQFTTDASPAAQAEDQDTSFDEEWVAKAHQVISRTHNDPYMQSKELSKLKAQYIKARYNKDIKVSEN